MSKELSTVELTKIVLTSLDDAKGHDVKVIDVQEKCSFADSMVIVSGTSERHVKSLANHVVEDVKKHGFRPLGTEGGQVGDWVLVDLGDVILHVMTVQTREFYQLEKLWETDFDVEVNGQIVEG